MEKQCNDHEGLGMSRTVLFQACPREMIKTRSEELIYGEADAFNGYIKTIQL